MGEELPFCECGECGLRVTKKGNRFISGHNKGNLGKAVSDKQKEQVSKTLKQFNKDHPESGKSHSDWLIQYYIDNPRIGKSHSDWLIEYCKDPEIKELMLKRAKNSDGLKAEHDRQRGGNDIVKHHHIYDHSNLSKYTIKMTRKEHSILHRNMQLLGLKVPHINTGHENEDELKLMEYIRKVESEPKGL